MHLVIDPLTDILLRVRLIGAIRAMSHPIMEGALIPEIMACKCAVPLHSVVFELAIIYITVWKLYFTGAFLRNL